MHKLTVTFGDGNEMLVPEKRKYTLTHSDETGQRYLYIGASYAYDAITPLHDEVTGEWIKSTDGYVFQAVCQLYSTSSNRSYQERMEIFKKHMPRAIGAMFSGDHIFIEENRLENSRVLCCYKGCGIDLTEVLGKASQLEQDYR